MMRAARVLEAIERDHVEGLRQWLHSTEWAGDGSAFGELSEDANSPLIVAAGCGATQCVQALLDLGIERCNPNALNRSQENALMHAIANKHAQAVALLIPVSNLATKKNNGLSALAIALNGGHQTATQRLLDAGAPLTQQSVIQMAMRKEDAQQLELLERVIREVKKRQLDWCDEETGVSALSYAVHSKKWKCADRLSQDWPLDSAKKEVLSALQGFFPKQKWMPHLHARLERQAMTQTLESPRSEGARLPAEDSPLHSRAGRVRL